MKKVLFFGPYPNPITGQSIAFKEIVDNYKGDKIICNITKFEKNKILNTFYVLSILPFLFISQKFDKVYFTCSRSKSGFVRDFWLIILSVIFKKKLINHLHGSDFNDFYEKSGYLKKVIKWAYSKVDTSIVLLPAMKVQFKDFENMKIEVVRNCYSKEFINDEHLTLINKKDYIITYLSNLMYSKGILVFLNSIPFLLKSYPNLKFKIAGDFFGDNYMSSDEIKKEFNNKLIELNIKHPNNIEYLGVVRGKDKIDLLKSSLFFVLPTFYKTEAFPISIIEAMFYGNCIITTNYKYLPDVVNEKNGVLIEVNNTESLVNSIDNLLQDKNLIRKISDYNIKLSREIYSTVNYVNSLTKILNNN